MRVHSAVFMFGLCLLLALGCGDSSKDTKSKKSSGKTSTSKKKSGAKKSSSAAKAAAPVKEGWGNLKGRFVVDGDAPSQSDLTTKGEYCVDQKVLDETVVVGENGGIAGIVVYLYAKRGSAAPEPHESYAESANAEVILDNKLCRFEPHVRLLRTTQTLVVKNSDPVGHNTKIDASENSAFNQTIPTGSQLSVTMEKAERSPVPVSCSIHPFMKGWLIVQDTPYCAVTDENGEFEIENLPAGAHTFQVWHEKLNNVQNVTVNGAEATWSKGRVEVVINGDETEDWGDVKIAADLLK
jgi:plastocyanin